MVLNYVDDETLAVLEKDIKVSLGSYKKLYEDLLIRKQFPYETGFLIPEAIELYFDYHSDKDHPELICLLLEQSAAYGLSDTQAEKLIRKYTRKNKDSERESNMNIRLFKPEDAAEVAQLVATTLKTSNSKDYSPEYIEDNISSHSPEVLTERAKWGHMYVVCDQTKIVGCGAIAGYWGGTTESILLTIFVLPEYQGRGIGSLIIRTLEQDEYFLRADRIEIPASITAVEFYRTMGYDYKNGIAELDEERLYRLEKFRHSLRSNIE